MGLEYQGGFLFLISGAEVEIVNSTGTHSIRTGSWKEVAPDDPSGASAARYRMHHAALVGEVSGKAQLEYAGAFGHALFPQGTVGGIQKLSAPLADAILEANQSEYAYQNASHVELEGDFEAVFPVPRQAGPGSPVSVSIEGDVSRVMEDRLNVKVLDRSLPVAAATAGISLLAVVVYSTISFARRGAVYVWSKAAFLKWLTIAPFAARLSGEAVMTHPLRKAIFELLRDQYPYVQLSRFREAAAERLGVGSWAVYKHLRVLHAHSHIDFLQPTSRGQLFIASKHGRVRDPTREVAAAMLHHPVGFALAESLLRSPDGTQADLIAYTQRLLREPGSNPPISKIGVLKWLRKFERFEVGAPGEGAAFGIRRRANQDHPSSNHVALVWRRRDGRFVRYSATPLLVEVMRAFKERPNDLSQALTEIEKAPTSLSRPDGFRWMAQTERANADRIPDEPS